jgi:glycosyltransferase involved in cell wall biosynthesis
LGAKVVGTLSGEDLFLEKLVEPYYSQARAALRERAGELDALVALNEYYADFMADYLSGPHSRIHVIPHGLNLAGHSPRPPRAPSEPPTIGYFARICADKGLHNLIAAAELLMDDPGLPPFRVRAAGYLGQSDRPYLETIQTRVAGWKSPKRFEYVGELTRDEKIAFFHSLDCMCLPTVYRESKGISVLEALANAVPVVLPSHGSFPEIVRTTGGGFLYEADNPRALADALRRVLANPVDAGEIGRLGHEVIHREFTAEGMARRHQALYRELTVG